MDVSIIIPIHNGGSWIDQCFQSIMSQNAVGSLKLEVCVCNDASTDDTKDGLEKWSNILGRKEIPLYIYTNETGTPLGVGYAKNRAVSISTGKYLCFQDIDDTMLPSRIMAQYNTAMKESENVIVGGRFKRNPEGSTARYTAWANSLSPEQLNTQIYTSNGPTVIMPTWFCHRSVFERIGGFAESGKGTPEDLLFFYKHLDLGGRICRVNECVLIYNYHPAAETFSIHEETIWHIRMERIQRDVLASWSSFTIWNAGKQGRKFFKSLTANNQAKVIAMCDVDVNKIGKLYVPYCSVTRETGPCISIVHFQKAQPPFVICMKLNLTNGDFEKNLQSLNLQENCDYIYFS